MVFTREASSCCMPWTVNFYIGQPHSEKNKSIIVYIYLHVVSLSNSMTSSASLPEHPHALVPVCAAPGCDGSP